MKWAQAVGLFVFFCSISLVLAGGAIGIPKKEDVPKYLIQLQSSTLGADRAKAADMLGKRGLINADDVKGAVDTLKTALQKDKDAKVRAAAARALGNIHPDAEGTVSLLIERLKTSDEAMDVKMASVVALGQYGPEAKEAAAPLRELATKFDAKKSKEGQTIMATLQSITGKKKKN